MWDCVASLFDPSGFPPRWQCGAWSPGLGWLHILSDAATWAAYFAIPCILGYYTYRRKDIPFRGILHLFVAFILLCGLTHLMDAVLFWWPAYRLDGLLKLLTAAVSWATVLALVRVTPHLLALRSPIGLEREIADRLRAEGELRALQVDLEERVRVRTGELQAAVTALAAEAAVRDRAEQRADEMVRVYRAIGESINYGVWVCDPTGRNTYASSSFLNLVGLTQEQCSEFGWGDVLHPDDLTGTIAAWKECVRVRGRWEREHRFLGTDGRYHPLLAVGVPVENEKGDLVCWSGINLDIGRLKRAEADLRESEERFRRAFDAAPIGMALVGLDGRWLRVNRSLCRILGYAEGELLATDFQALTHPDDLDADLSHAAELVAGGGTAYHLEKRFFHRAGHVIHADLSVSVVRDEGGRPLYSIEQVQDVTARKRAEELVKASLREKEVLLKEIHHRVKNNLQIVSTLLDLQSGYTADPAARAMFRESRGRVKSMAFIHERLYRAQDMARVDFAEYTRQLARDLFSTYRVTDGVRLELAVDTPPLPIDLAIPCGLLLNELISNCLKHAFVGAAGGCVRVVLRRDGAFNELVVADDGVGFPAGTDFRNTTSFGLQLATTLVEQLNGDIHLTADRGTTFTVRFPAPVDPPPIGTRP